MKFLLQRAARAVAALVAAAPLVVHARLAFKASLTARFPIHEHREGAANHRAVLFIEVHP